MGECRYNNPQTCWGQVHSWRNSTRVKGITAWAALECCSSLSLLLWALLPPIPVFPWGFAPVLCFSEDISGLTGGVMCLYRLGGVSGPSAVPSRGGFRDLFLLIPNSPTMQLLLHLSGLSSSVRNCPPVFPGCPHVMEPFPVLSVLPMGISLMMFLCCAPVCSKGWEEEQQYALDFFFLNLFFY